MTWRMDGLDRRALLAPGRSSARCGECAWGVSRRSPSHVSRLARSHTRGTGHVTRTQSVKVTEYRRRDGSGAAS